ncbi:hypothetical protein D3C84_1017390 [compost metagenome]
MAINLAAQSRLTKSRSAAAGAESFGYVWRHGLLCAFGFGFYILFDVLVGELFDNTFRGNVHDLSSEHHLYFLRLPIQKQFQFFLGVIVQLLIGIEESCLQDHGKIPGAQLIIRQQKRSFIQRL